jgi:hypothetical protein
MSFGNFVPGAILGLVLGLHTVSAGAESYPSKPIKIIVPYAVGGATDLITRLVAQYLTTSLGVGIIVENRAGGGGTLATKAVAQADPDGYTLPPPPTAPSRSGRRSTGMSATIRSRALRRWPIWRAHPTWWWCAATCR